MKRLNGTTQEWRKVSNGPSWHFVSVINLDKWRYAAVLLPPITPAPGEPQEQASRRLASFEKGPKSLEKRDTSAS